MDVNIKFHRYFISSVTGFEFTADREVFELMNIQLVHGWVVENQKESEALGTFSYNQAIDFILSQPDDPRTATIKEFFERSASQLTEVGLNALKKYLQNGQLAIFFRNNHFSTIIKNRDEIFLLATDVAFIEVHEVIWECISGVSGNGYYCDANFVQITDVNHEGEDKVEVLNEFSSSLYDFNVNEEERIISNLIENHQLGGDTPVKVVPNSWEEKKNRDQKAKVGKKLIEKNNKVQEASGNRGNNVVAGQRIEESIGPDISLTVVSQKESKKKNIKKCKNCLVF